MCLDWIWERGVQARIWTCSDTKYDVSPEGLSYNLIQKQKPKTKKEYNQREFKKMVRYKLVVR